MGEIIILKVAPLSCKVRISYSRYSGPQNALFGTVLHGVGAAMHSVCFQRVVVGNAVGQLFEQHAPRGLRGRLVVSGIVSVVNPLVVIIDFPRRGHFGE